MTTTTKNLKLFKYDTSTDGKNVFSIDNALNDNWNIIDSNTLQYRQISNCVLEIPQTIKLESNNGKFTLKAGSVIPIPNGFELDGITQHFDYYTLTTDYTYDLSAESQSSSLLMFNEQTISHRKQSVTRCYAGPSAPSISGYATWYDTANNIIKLTNDSGATWYSRKCSFPVANIDVIDGKVVIKSVFNGMGFIGNAIWIDKGVTILIPDGRNEDGSLKNIKYTCPKIQVRTFDGSAAEKNLLVSDTGFTTVAKQNCYISETPPQSTMLSGFISAWYDSKNNKMYKADATSGIPVYTPRSGVLIDTNYIFNGTQISEWCQPETISLLKCSDKTKISGWGMPSDKYINLTLGATGSTYVAPANGYFYVRAKTGGSTKITYVTFINTTNSLTSTHTIYLYNTSVKYTVATQISARKGDTIILSYDLATKVENQMMRFVYAEGAQ